MRDVAEKMFKASDVEAGGEEDRHDAALDLFLIVYNMQRLNAKRSVVARS